MLSDRCDLERMRAGLRRLLDLIEHPAIRGLSAVRVVDVDGLRVIDASVIPACLRANSALATIMLAEKLASEL
ncbi:MAG TPA: GMC oxidoreductase [Thermoanaerobaculia bacterium]